MRRRLRWGWQRRFSGRGAAWRWKGGGRGEAVSGRAISDSQAHTHSSQHEVFSVCVRHADTVVHIRQGELEVFVDLSQAWQATNGATRSSQRLAHPHLYLQHPQTRRGSDLNRHLSTVVGAIKLRRLKCTQTCEHTLKTHYLCLEDRVVDQRRGGSVTVHHGDTLAQKY